MRGRTGGPGVNAWRLALGTLTVLPVRAPGTVDRRTAGAAMVLAPLVGGLLAVVVGLPLWLLERSGALSPLVLAVLGVAALAVLTRAIHLDGLADTADGLGSGRGGEAALTVMRRSDIGPFGTVTLLLVLGLQVALLAQALAGGYGVLLLALALTAGRAVLLLVCTARFPAAREGGLGATVAGSVGVRGATVGVLLTAVLLALLAGAAGLADPAGPDGWLGWRLGAAVLLGPLAGLLLAAHAVRRFGGITGDVLGAATEVSTTAALLTGVLAAG